MDFLSFFSSITQFEYQLVVTSMFPEEVSLHGDSLITIKGQGFGANSPDVKVEFGNIACEIQTISDNQIECVTKPPIPIFYVDNQGSHPGKYLQISKFNFIGGQSWIC